MSFRWIRFLTLSYEIGQGITSIWHVKKVSLESLYENCIKVLGEPELEGKAQTPDLQECKALPSWPSSHVASFSSDL